MMTAIDRYFGLSREATSVRREVLAGLTTFVTMAYIIIVNPKILEAAGMPFGASMVATILTAVFGTLLMGVYAKRPFAIAPYMGENAFLAYTVVKVMGFSWQTALGAVLLGGILFTLLTVLKVRSWLAEAIPESLKIGFAGGVGLFLAFIGLNDTGIVRLGVEGAPVRVGNFHDPAVLLAVLGFLAIGLMMYRKVHGAIIFGILGVTLCAFLSGAATPPSRVVSLPPDIGPVFLQLDVAGALSWGFLSVVLTIFVMGFVDTIGTLIALAFRAKLLDEKGNLPDIEKPMLADALTTTVAPLLGTTTSGAFIESATGIEAGGRTGLTAVVTAVLFLSALFFAPLFAAIPPFAYGPALIIVGLLMMTPVVKLPFDDFSEVLPAFCVIVLMSFTYNIGIGMTAGFLVYPLLKLLTGRRGEIRPGMWVLAGLSLLFYVFYPF
jgi:AGZA family xanthine/uracil permease-like MFS transporter